MTVKEVAAALGVDSSNVSRRVKELFPEIVKNGKQTFLNEYQVTIIKNVFLKNGKLGDIAKIKTDNTELEENKMISTTEFAKQLKTTNDVILSNAKKCLQNKKIENGKITFWNKEEVTIIIDYMQKNNNRTDLPTFDTVSKVSTELTPALKIKQAMLLMQEGYEEELAIIKQRAELAEQKCIEQKPKADVYDAICDSSTLQDLQTVAQTIGITNIFKVLIADGIIKKEWTKDNILFYRPYSDYNDYLVLKDGRPYVVDGVSHVRPRIFVTGKGITWLTKKYKDAE